MRGLLTEREVLWAMAPHIIWPLRSVLSHNLSDVFAVPDEIAEATVRYLELELLPEKRRAEGRLQAAGLSSVTA